MEFLEPGLTIAFWVMGAVILIVGAVIWLMFGDPISAINTIWDWRQLNKPKWWEDDEANSKPNDDVEIVEIDFDIRK